MKYFALMILVLLLSCTKKDTSECYVCSITYIMTTDVPVDGYPSTTSINVDLCDVTIEQVRDFEQVNKGSETALIGNVTYSSSFSTQCAVK